MNPQMFNSFLDGTKSGIEMAAVANATGLMPPPDGLGFPPCGTHEMAELLRPVGQVEVVSSLHRDGTPVVNDLRWGVYVLFEAPNDYTARCFKEYGVVTDATGRISAPYRPFHLIGLELNISILSAALRGEATGVLRQASRGDVRVHREKPRNPARGRDAGWRRRRLRLGETAAGAHQCGNRRSADRPGEPRASAT